MKKTQSALVFVCALSLFAAQPAHAYDPADTSASGEISMPGQPFAHPADDMSYSRDLQEDEIRAQAKPADNGEVQYISGGVGDDDMNAIEAEQSEYNLKLLFAAGGAYLANVGVHIEDSKGNAVLDMVTDGPVLLIKMPRGRYTVTATTQNGEVRTQRIAVSGDRRASYVLHYPTIEK